MLGLWMCSPASPKVFAKWKMSFLLTDMYIVYTRRTIAKHTRNKCSKSSHTKTGCYTRGAKLHSWQYHCVDTHKPTNTQTQRHVCTYTDKSTSRGAITVRQAWVRAMHWCYITGWPGTAKHFFMWANNNSIWSAICVCVCEKEEEKGVLWN